MFYTDEQLSLLLSTFAILCGNKYEPELFAPYHASIRLFISDSDKMINVDTPTKLLQWLEKKELA